MRSAFLKLSVNAPSAQSQNLTNIQLRTSEPRTYYWLRRRFVARPKATLGTQRDHVDSNFKFLSKQVAYQPKFNYLHTSRLTRHSNLAPRVFSFTSTSLSNILIRCCAPNWNSLVLWYKWVLHSNLTLCKLLLNFIHLQHYLSTTTKRSTKLFKPRNESLLIVTSTLLL